MAIRPSLHHFDIAGGRVAFAYEPSDRPLVVLIHGNSVDGAVFESQIPLLRHHGFGILVPDLPGHGGSSDVTDPNDVYSFPGYARIVGGILDALGAGEAHVAGWSLGGHVGLELMGSDPRIRSLFIWGTPPVRPSAEALGDAFFLSPVTALAGQAVLSAEDVAMYARALTGDEALAERLCPAIARTDGAARSCMMRNGVGGVGLDARALVAQDPRPLAVLHGEADPFIKLAYIERLAFRNLWRGRVQVLAGLGHAPHLQAPEAFNALLLAFLLSTL